MDTFARLLGRAVLLCLLAIPVHGVAAPAEAIPCVSCANLGDLTVGANQYARATPYPADGTILYVVSTSANVSAYYRVASVRICASSAGAHVCSSGGVIQKYVVAITQSDAEAQATDIQMYAKALGPVTVAPQWGTSASSALAYDVNTGIRAAYPVLFAPFTARYYIILNGKTVFVKPGVTELTVKFPDGSKMKFRLSEDALSTVAWILQGRSDASGNPVDGPDSQPGDGGGGGGNTYPPPPPTPPATLPNFCPVVVRPQVCVFVPDYGGNSCETQVMSWFIPC